MMGLETATRMAPGLYRAECPTAHEVYTTADAQLMKIGHRPVVWLRCPLCDALLHTGAACDPRNPQYHLYLDGDRNDARTA